jgi:hypothetical protein
VSPPIFLFARGAQGSWSLPLFPTPHPNCRRRATPPTNTIWWTMTMGVRFGTSIIMQKNRTDRKNSWVMLAESGGYTPLPGEQTLYQSPPRTTLSIQSSSRHTPSEAYSKQCKSGVVYLTNRRVWQFLRHHPLPSEQVADVGLSRSYIYPSLLPPISSLSRCPSSTSQIRA